MRFAPHVNSITIINNGHDVINLWGTDMFVLNVFNELQLMYRYTLFSELGQLNIMLSFPQEHNNCIIEMILICSDYKQNGDMVAV